MTSPSQASPRAVAQGHKHLPHIKIFPQKSDLTASSPGLLSETALLPAYEMKFLLSEPLVEEIVARLGGELQPDSHDGSSNAGYRVTTLYTDTDGFDVFYGEKPFRRHKYRLRRYGLEPSVYLERRSRWRDRIKKHRSAISVEEVSWFAREHSPLPWEGHWFHRRLIEGNLHPASRVTYRRAAYSCGKGEGAMRLTFDRSVRCCLTEDWTVEPFEGGLPVLEERVIGEVKFFGVMPLKFKNIVREFGLRPIRISKYREAMRVAGHLTDQRNHHA
jgi:hypothetical protein